MIDKKNRTDKLPNMVALMEKPKRLGRPRKFTCDAEMIHVTLPEDLRDAVKSMESIRKLPNTSEAVRELLREAAEARGLVEKRK